MNVTKKQVDQIIADIPREFSRKLFIEGRLVHQDLHEKYIELAGVQLALMSELRLISSVCRIQTYTELRFRLIAATGIASN